MGLRLQPLQAVARLRISYSDDQGKTWEQAQVEEGPLQVGQFPMSGSLLEAQDGTLAVPVYGYRNARDISVSLYTSTLVRSSDGGRTWGDWSVIAYDRYKRYTAYSETSIRAMSEDFWVAFIRSENRSYVPFMTALVSRAVSNDRGFTWSAPKPSGAAGMLGSVRLGDGGLAVAGQNTCGWGVTISYDAGET